MRYQLCGKKSHKHDVSYLERLCEKKRKLIVEAEQSLRRNSFHVNLNVCRILNGHIDSTQHICFINIIISLFFVNLFDAFDGLDGVSML